MVTNRVRQARRPNTQPEEHTRTKIKGNYLPWVGVWDNEDGTFTMRVRSGSNAFDFILDNKDDDYFVDQLTVQLTWALRDLEEIKREG